MQAKQTMVLVTIVIATIVILCTVLYVGNQIPELPVIPTAAEIAALIVIPTAEIPIIPDFPETRLSLTQALKADGLALCDEEFDFDEIEDLYNDDDEVDYVKEYVDKIHYYNIDLGIDNLDDRTITIDREYKVSVEEDNGDDYKERVEVTCKVTSDDGELEAEIIY